MSVSDPHDKYFRSVMQIIVIARQFLQWFLPKQVSNILDFDSLKPFDGTYIEGDLSKTMSDVVFDCHYKHKEGDDKDQNQYQHSKIVILIEHQSTPDKFMPIRVFNYLFNLLNKHMQSDDFKNDDSNQLPAIYPMVFYHGKRKRYPYSMKVIDCVENPANIMHQFAALKVQLININELPQQVINQQGLAGIVTDAMRRIPKHLTQDNYLSVFKRLGELEAIPHGFTKTTMKYMINVKNVDNIDALIEKSAELTDSVRGEIMTIAEALEARGEARGEARAEAAFEARTEAIEARAETKAMIQVAKNLLEKGLATTLIAETTNLEMGEIEGLRQQLKQELSEQLDKKH